MNRPRHSPAMLNALADRVAARQVEHFNSGCVADSQLLVDVEVALRAAAKQIESRPPRVVNDHEITRREMLDTVRDIARASRRIVNAITRHHFDERLADAVADAERIERRCDSARSKLHEMLPPAVREDSRRKHVAATRPSAG